MAEAREAEFNDQHRRIVVAYCCQTFRARGWEFHFDDCDNVWDVQTPNGWRTAATERELAAIAAEGK